MRKTRVALMTIFTCLTIAFFMGVAMAVVDVKKIEEKAIENAAKAVVLEKKVESIEENVQEQGEKVEENKQQVTAIQNKLKYADKTLESCKRNLTHAVYTNDLPSWGSETLGGEWTVGTAISAQTLRYDFAKKKASFNTGVGIGASFRYYKDIKTVGWDPKDPTNPATILKLHQVKAECRASSFREADENTIATPMFSITPTIYASQFEDDDALRVEPAIMVGFFQDLINVGVGFNLTGKDGDVGDVFALFSIGFGFNFGGEDNASAQQKSE